MPVGYRFKALAAAGTGGLQLKYIMNGFPCALKVVSDGRGLPVVFNVLFTMRQGGLRTDTLVCD